MAMWMSLTDFLISDKIVGLAAIGMVISDNRVVLQVTIRYIKKSTSTAAFGQSTYTCCIQSHDYHAFLNA